MSRLLLIRLYNKDDRNIVYCIECGKPYYESKRVKFQHLACLMPFTNNYVGCASIVLAGHLDCISMLKISNRVLFSEQYISYLLVCLLENLTYADIFIIKLAKTEIYDIIQNSILAILCNWPLLGKKLIFLCSRKNKQQIIQTLLDSRNYDFPSGIHKIFRDALQYLLQQG